MVLKTMNMNHECDNLHDAFSMPRNQQERCRERVFFATYANALQGDELYEDADDCPREFHTKTGDLSRTLKLISDPLEYEYTLLMFMKMQPMAQETYSKYKAMNDQSISKSARSKLELLMSLHDLAVRHKRDEEKEEEGGDNSDDTAYFITPSSLMKRIDLVKRSHYSWETYFNMIKSKNFFYVEDDESSNKSGGSDFDIDDMLRGVFGKDDE